MLHLAWSFLCTRVRQSRVRSIPGLGRAHPLPTLAGYLVGASFFKRAEGWRMGSLRLRGKINFFSFYFQNNPRIGACRDNSL